MESTSTKQKNSRTARIKAARALKKVPTAILLKKKAECDAKALAIVERMMEPEVQIEWLLQNLSWINKSHMEDVSEERSIVKLCGYVLCDNPLTKVVTKQYKISTHTNKVYDVSKVRNYCSFSCYKAAEYLMEQMLTSPLWLRDQEEIPKFHIMDKKCIKTRSSSPPGVEVDLIGIKLSDEIINLDKEKEDKSNEKNEKDHENCRMKDEIESEDYTTVNVDIMEKKDNPVESELTTELDKESIYTSASNYVNVSNATSDSKNVEPVFNETKVPMNECESERDTIEHLEATTHSAEKISSIPVEKSSVRRKKEQRVAKKSSSTFSYETPTARVEKSFKEWITDRTISLLHGKIEEKQEIIENFRREERYAVLCKKLQHLQLEEEKKESKGVGDLRPAPDFSTLQREAKQLELKVRAFWKGKTVMDQDEEKVEDSTKENEDRETVLPLIDHHALGTLRRRIFLDKLNKVLPDVLRALEGQSSTAQYSYTSDQCSTVKTLVSTFALSSTNIIFKTAEWTLVALIIIKLLGIMDTKMKYLFSTKQATMYTSMILMSYKLESNYLDYLITSVTRPPDTRENGEDSWIDL